MLVIGAKEQDSNTVAVRARDGEVRYGLKLPDFVAEVRKKIESRT